MRYDSDCNWPLLRSNVMKTFKAIVYLNCNTDAQAASTVDALRECLKAARDSNQILDSSLDFVEEIPGRIRADEPIPDDTCELPMGLAYDEIFEPDSDAL